MTDVKKKRNGKPKNTVYDLYGQLVELKTVQTKQLKPVFCVSNTNIKKPGIVSTDFFNSVKSHIEAPNKVLNKLNSKLTFEAELETGYVSPVEIKYLFDRVKLSEGVKLIENGHVKKESKPETTYYGNSAFRITKSDYNRM